MQVAILLYDGVTALDAIGPYEVLHQMPDTEVRFVATKKGPIETNAGIALLNAGYKLGDVQAPDILLIPGAPDPQAALGDDAVLAWVRKVHENTAWTTSVCTGALILGAAGVLAGVHATTHWLAMEQLEAFGAIPKQYRVVKDGTVMTSAGVSAGIDMALTLVAEIFDDETAQSIQLLIEYDPQPPFDAGSPDKAPAEVRGRVRQMFATATGH